MEDRKVGFEIEALDVEHATVARFHNDRYLTLTRYLTHEEFHVQRIALFDDEIETFHERLDIFFVDAISVDDDAQVWIYFGDAPREDDCFVDTEVLYPTWNSVEIRHLDRVEIGETQFAREPFHGEQVRN